MRNKLSGIYMFSRYVVFSRKIYCLSYNCSLMLRIDSLAKWKSILANSNGVLNFLQSLMNLRNPMKWQIHAMVSFVSLPTSKTTHRAASWHVAANSTLCQHLISDKHHLVSTLNVPTTMIITAWTQSLNLQCAKIFSFYSNGLSQLVIA